MSKTRETPQMDTGETGIGHVAVSDEETASARSRSWWDILNRYGLVLALLLVIVVFSILRPDAFPTLQNAASILTGSAPLVLIALAVMTPLVVHEFDLAAGSVATFGGLLAVGFMWYNGWPWWVAILGPLVICAIIGTLTGVLAAYAKLSSLIVTLASGVLIFGVSQIYSNNTTIFLRGSDTFQALGQTRLFGFIPLPVIYVAVIAIAIWYVLEYQPVGRRLYAIGGSEEGARLVGINVARLKMLVFTTSGVLAALGGIIQASRVGSANPTGVSGLLLPAFAAAFLGATSIKPGHYNVWGTVVAVYLVASLTTGMIMLGAPRSVSDVFNGAILLIAVGLARLSTRRTTGN